MKNTRNIMVKLKKNILVIKLNFNQLYKIYINKKK